LLAGGGGFANRVEAHAVNDAEAERASFSAGSPPDQGIKVA